MLGTGCHSAVGATITPMRHSIIIAVLLLVSFVGSAETLTERRMSSADIGTVVFMAPEKWAGFQTYDDLQAASVYEFSPRKGKFRLRIGVKYAGFETRGEQATLDEQIIARLDGYLQYAIADYADTPDKYQIRAARFSPRNHGIYSRITDRNPGKGSYPYFTLGARVLGDKLITFSLNSSDEDLSVLKQTLDVITSFSAKNEWANAPESFLCKVDKLVGFAIVDEEWDAIVAGKVKHNFIVRRSRAGDVYADSSEWVFAGPENEDTDTRCDNEYISHGLFYCRGDSDDAFRMDSKTLRFVYVFFSGYHNVPQDVIPDEESPKPQMGIGTCTAK